jgi:hypothetical protein
MATKKKSEATVEKKPAAKKVAKKAEPKKTVAAKKTVSKKIKTNWPKVTVGTHLTVTEHEDGRTELVWDDEQLLKEVREAIASASGTQKASAITGNIKEKKTRKTKSK